MQQTEKYKLNLIESSDPFLPDGLNQNTQKLEDVISATLSAQDSKVDNWMTGVAKNLGAGGKNARIGWGSYVGDGTFGPDHPMRHTFSFYPVLIIVGMDLDFYTDRRPGIFIRGLDLGWTAASSSGGIRLNWTENGVWYYNSSHNGSQNNYPDKTYYYFGIGYDKQAEK